MKDHRYNDFVSKKIKFLTDEECDDAIRKKIIESLHEMCYNYFIQDLALQEKNDYEIITTSQENFCLSIFHELIKQYGNEYAQDIFNTIESTLEKRFTNFIMTSENY